MQKVVKPFFVDEKPCITFDQPLWLKPVEISSEKSLEIVCHLGGFHTLKSFLGSVGTSMKGSGLSECMQMVYGENTMIHILSGKSISRSLRAHFLVQSALMLNVIANIIQEKLISKKRFSCNQGFLWFLHQWWPFWWWHRWIWDSC